MSSLAIYLLTARTTDGTDGAEPWSSNGPGTLHVFGTWDGATVTISGSGDGVNFDVPVGAIYTSDSIEEFEAGNINVKATISSAGASTSLTAILVPSSGYMGR